MRRYCHDHRAGEIEEGWHQRAAAVSLIHSTRQHKNFEHIQRVTEILLPSDDDMVQKGLAGCCARPPKPIRSRRSST